MRLRGPRVVTGGLGTVVLLTSCAPFGSIEFEIDASQMQKAEARLRPVVTDFDNVPAPDGARAGEDAEFVGCHEESGYAAQPLVQRVFWLEGDARRSDVLEVSPEARGAAVEAANALSARGWKTVPDPDLADQTTISMEIADGTVEGVVLATNDSIILSVATNLTPCSVR